MDGPSTEAPTSAGASAGDGVTTIGILPAGLDLSHNPATATFDRVGRFVVLRELGRGAMGVVLAAFDEELDRRVAIKLITAGANAGSEGRARMQREAQALAMLSHPNVVHVYEVGQHQGFTFIAMEFVLGTTLRDYLTTSPDRSGVLDALMQAGRGLAAAHHAGLTHRDFKPANVLVGEDGRIRVADFGLARMDLDDVPPSKDGVPAKGPHDRHPRGGGTGPHSVASAPLTVAGVVMGTPAYMAPEQALGHDADAKSDQYAFGVVMYEALVGKRPPRPKDRTDGDELAIDGRADISTTLRKIVRRALELDPGRRFEHMDALLAALEADRAPRRWSPAAIALILAGAVGVGLAVASPNEAAPCTETGDAIGAVWNERSRGAVTATMTATGLSYAGASADRAIAGMDAWASQWLDARYDACAASRISGEQSDALLDLRMVCLDRALHGLRATIDILASADVAVVGRSQTLVGGLPTISQCADAEALMAELPPPSDAQTATAVASARAVVEEAIVKSRAGRYAEALEAGQAALASAAELDYPPLTIEARFIVANALRKTGTFDAAEEALAELFWDALAAGHDAIAIRAGTSLVFLVGHQRVLFKDAQRWWVATDAVVRRRGNRYHEVTSLATSWGSALKRAGKLEEAREQFEAVLALAVENEGDDCRSCATYLNNLGNVLHASGDLAGARNYFERALRKFEATRSPGHPVLGYAHANIGAVSAGDGDFAAANAEFGYALDVWSTALSKDHPDVANLRVQRAMVFDQLEQIPQARAELERAIASFQRTDDTNPRLVDAYQMLAELSEGDAAVTHYRAAIKTHERAGRDDTPQILEATVSLAEALSGLGRRDEALAQVTVGRAMTLTDTPEVAKLRDRAGAVEQAILAAAPAATVSPAPLAMP